MTMIEKVARALCAAECGDPDAITIHQQPQWKIWEGHARAVIEAMREPTADMKIAGMDASAYRFDPTPQWQAMIDAALAEEKAPA